MIYQFYTQNLLPHVLDRVMSGAPFPAYRQEVLQDVAGDVLELGFGTGLNLPYYPEQVKSLAIVDPNQGMHRLAETRLATSKLLIRREVARGEALPFAAENFDCVVSTWTLCSIAQVEQAITEIYRVLKPGGKFMFIEHGLAEDSSIQRWQHWLTPFQKVIGDGCHLNRDILAIVRRSFETVSLKTYYADSLPKFSGYFYQGIAVK